MKKVSKQAKKNLKEKWTAIDAFGLPIDLLALQEEDELDPFHNYKIFLCPFKTPLDDRYSDMLEDKDMVSPRDISKYYEENHDISIKVVYNLTYTDRYYDPK